VAPDDESVIVLQISPNLARHGPANIFPHAGMNIAQEDNEKL